MQEQELNEVLEIMVEKMLEMERQIEVLNEKQNKEDGKGVQDATPTDNDKQIPIAGL